MSFPRSEVSKRLELPTITKKRKKKDFKQTVSCLIAHQTSPREAGLIQGVEDQTHLTRLFR